MFYYVKQNKIVLANPNVFFILYLQKSVIFPLIQENHEIKPIFKYQKSFLKLNKKLVSKVVFVK